MIEVGYDYEGKPVIVLSRSMMSTRGISVVEGGLHKREDLVLTLQEYDWHDLEDLEAVVREIRSRLRDTGLDIEEDDEEGDDDSRND